MPASAQAEPRAESGQRTGCYVYGILPADVELSADVEGVGDPPGRVRLVHGGRLAALISDVNLDKPLGSPEDLRVHKEILDATATEAPVLPLRFGSVLTSEDEVADQLLRPNEDGFTAALEELDGRAEYVVKGRYDEQAILREILSEDAEAAQLRDEIRATGEDAARDARIRLGEIVSDSVAAKRDQDTRALLDAVADDDVDCVVREPTHEYDAVHVALLVHTERKEDLAHALRELEDRWQGRVGLRLLGPMAAYDFIGTYQEDQG